MTRKGLASKQIVIPEGVKVSKEGTDLGCQRKGRECVIETLWGVVGESDYCMNILFSEIGCGTKGSKRQSERT